ncbi:MAG: tetratricopeptide repeat protein [Hyphomonadaceae bacterium]
MTTRPRFMLRIFLLVFAAAALALASGVWAHSARAAGNSGSSTPMPGGSGFDPARAYQEGVAALQAGDYETAVNRLRRVADVAPRDGTVQYVYALALIGSGEQSDARRPLERAVRDDAVPPDAFNQLGQVYLAGGRRDDAVAQQTRLNELLAGCDAECGDQRRGQIQAAQAALEAALNPPAAPPGDPQMSWLIPDTSEGRAAYAYAVGLINTERWTDALAALDHARLAIGPHPDILNYMGFASRRLGRYETALAFYREALSLDRDHLGANEYLGELYLEMGRTEEAERQLARLDRLCPYGCAEREELARWIQLASN